MFAMEFNQLVEEDHRRVIRATWNHQTNLTAENAAILYTLRAEIVENAKVIPKQPFTTHIQNF